MRTKAVYNQIYNNNNKEIAKRFKENPNDNRTMLFYKWYGYELDDSIEEFNDEIFVKVRSTGKLLKGKVNFKNDNTALVNLKKFEDGISPGQACVFYSKDEFGDKVLGGGWIDKTFNNKLST